MSRGMIFYGAGQNAKDIILQWIEEGSNPVCFVAADITKHSTKFVLNESRELDIIPLEDALKKYPDSDLYITLKRKSLKSVTEYLLEAGIEKERIKYFEEVEYRLGCDALGKNYLMEEHRIGTCYVPGYRQVGISATDNPKEDFIRYNDYFISGILGKWKNDDANICSGCKNLRYDIFDKQPVLEKITLGGIQGEDFCNARCFYCCNYPRPTLKTMEKRKNDVIEIFSTLAGELLNHEIEVDISVGDISVAPFRKELCDIIKENNWKACIRTNAAVYSEEIAELLKRENTYTLITLDSTVSEIYAKCKGIDCLPRVMDNIRRYAAVGEVWLKWIVLDGMYKKFDEVKGILDFAKEIGAKVFLSCDTWKIDTGLSEQMLEITLSFIEYAKQENIDLIILKDHFTEKDYECLVNETDL